MHTDIEQSLQCLYEGKLILYPTDTVWGIGCDATNEEAVQKIFKLKQRVDAKSMLILLDQMGRLGAYVEHIPDLAWDLTEMSQKPITIIYPKGKNLAPSLLAEDSSVGIRICKEPFAYKLIQRFKKPIVSTSANISGAPTPNLFSEISQEVKHGVDYVVKYRQEDNTKQAASSIIKLGLSGEIKVIRE